ncbi:hypothetical protein MKX03_018350 [Papaver bracteatum]|nr:hypothetical protein MKX03_018350 [Papaver bracteatum]
MGIIGQVLFAVLVVFCIAAEPNLANHYAVGNSLGWAPYVDYQSWVGGKTFTVGDSLVFNYGPTDTVDEVRAAEYASCAAEKPITSDSSGSTIISLTTSGVHYFISSTTDHCYCGMKVAVMVAESTSDDASSSDSSLTPLYGATTTPTTSHELPVPSLSPSLLPNLPSTSQLLLPM